ncbi:MAG: murein biosynthesis integral membrane protein MurJ, partial [Actinomycetales bacterium]|nr:murein biosynthesis integral membrane protein MurJ [Actinomycetales bacterium]
MTQRSGGLASSATLMFTGTLASRVLGLVRNALLVAAIFSIGGAADAFSVANKLPNIFYMLIAGGVLNAILVPQIVRAMRHDDGGQEYVNRLLTLAGALLLGLTVLLTAASSVLVTVYASEFRDGPWAALAITFGFWCIPQLFFYGMYTLLGQVLNARSNFGPYMWAPVANNIVAIAGLVAYLVIFGRFDSSNPAAAADWTSARIALLAGTATLGVIMQAVVLIVPLYRSGFRFRLTWGVRNSGLRSASRVAMWAFAALAVGQVGYIAVSNLAAAASTAGASAGDLSVAGNAAYDNAFLVFMLPQSLITVSLVTAMFTRMSANAAGGDLGKVRADLSLALRTLGVFTVFASGALAVLAIPMIQVIQFDRADFEAYRAVAHVLVAMLAGLTAIAVWTMTQRVYYAFEDTRSLFLIQIPMAAIVLVGCVLTFLLLDAQWWVAGAGAATAVSSTFGALVSYLALRRRLPSLDGARVLRTHVRLVLAMLPAALIGWGLLRLWGVQTSFVGALVRVLTLGLLMGIVYLVLLRRLRVSELDSLLARVGGMAAPLTRRLRPALARIPGGASMRTMWGRMSRTDDGDKGAAVTQGTSTVLTAGTTIADRYHLITEIPTDVEHTSLWLGEDDILQREVRAVIVDGPRREEALDAARRAALIDDSRLARVLRVGNHEGHGFVVTEVVPGPSLADLLRGGPLGPGQARALIGEAASAVESARRRGVHHLRLRPSVLHRTDDGAVLLTGLAIDAAQAGVEGRDARATARADSIGLVSLLYTALTGTWPGDPQLAGGVPLASRHGDVPTPPGDVVDGVPHDLDTLCAVTFGPHDDGPFTPAELIRDLAPWDDVEVTPIPAAPTSAALPAEEPFGGPAVAAGAATAAGLASGGPSDAVDPEAVAASAAQQDTFSPETSPEATTQLSPVRGPLDPSRWTLKPPPAGAEPAQFEAVLGESDTEAAGTGIYETHAARHERVISAHVPTMAERLAARGAALLSGIRTAASGARGAGAAGTGAAGAGAAGQRAPGTGISATTAGDALDGAGPHSDAVTTTETTRFDAAMPQAPAGWDLPAAAAAAAATPGAAGAAG